jgi:uncharacterized glyoxalase superfamily protein PhnB
MPIAKAVPLLRVADVARSLAWYRGTLGFSADPFPAQPPHQFALLRHGPAEIMLRRGPPPTRAAGAYDWDVYLRLEQTPFRDLYAKLQGAGLVTRRLEWMFYGLAEFELTDPDGYVLCLSQELPDDADLPRPEIRPA